MAIFIAGLIGALVPADMRISDDDNDCRRSDFGTHYSGLVMLDNSTMMSEDVRRGLSVSASRKVGDRHALWSSPSWPEKREVEGSLDGFPVRTTPS